MNNKINGQNFTAIEYVLDYVNSTGEYLAAWFVPSSDYNRLAVALGVASDVEKHVIGYYDHEDNFMDGEFVLLSDYTKLVDAANVITVARSVGMVVAVERGMWALYNAAVQSVRPLFRYSEIDTVRLMVMGLLAEKSDALQKQYA